MITTLIPKVSSLTFLSKSTKITLMNTFIYTTLLILAFGLAFALLQQMYFSATLITIFAVTISKYVKDGGFRYFLNHFF